MEEVKQRLKKGYDYFWNLKPSKVRPTDIVFLHVWLKMFGEVNNSDPAQPLDETNLEKVTKTIFG